MPEVSAAPSPVMPVSPAVTSATPTGAGAADASAADQENGFANVLKSQMASDSKASGNKPEESTTASSTSPTKTEPATSPDANANALAALLPQLIAASLGAAAPAVSSQNAGGEATALGKAQKSRSETDAPATLPTGLLLQAPAGRLPGEDAPVAGNPGRAATAVSANLSAPGGNSPAIIAGETDGAATPSTKPTVEASFESLLNAAQMHSTLKGAESGTKIEAANPHEIATARVTTPVGSSGWGDEIGNKLTWMAGREASRADLVLTPPNMGRIEVSITMNGDQANAVFASAHPAVREALENALPRLREILADAGIQLDQAQVDAQTARQWSNGRETGDNAGPGTGYAPRTEAALTETTLASSATPWTVRGNRMLDVFA